MPLFRQMGKWENYILITLIYISSISPTNFNLLFDARCFLLFFFSFPFQKYIRDTSWRHCEQDCDLDALFDARLAHSYASIIADGKLLVYAKMKEEEEEEIIFTARYYWVKLIFRYRICTTQI